MIGDGYHVGDCRELLKQLPKDGCSIKYLDVDRESLRKLISEGWTFDDDTMKWANDGRG